MAENEPTDSPSDHQPALPAPQLPTLPPGMDTDEYRRFQEFQRFQDHQGLLDRDGETQGGTAPGVVTPYGGTQLHGTASAAPPAHHEIAEQLAGMRQQLTDLATTQAKIDRTINPPLWRRILRSRLVHRLIWLGVIAIVILVGAPLLIENVFGDNTNANNGLPLPKEKSGILANNPLDAVGDVYLFVAGNHPVQACDGFSLLAQLEFARAANAANCVLAVGILARQVTDRASYENPNMREVPIPTGGTDTISSCQFTVTGGPRLGTFTVTRQSVGWEITHYVPPTDCPASTTPTN